MCIITHEHTSMNEKVVAMILAGGKGTRLEALTKKVAKPLVGFAAKYHIIDFALSNCANSGISDVGVLCQYESNALDSYLGNGDKWGFNGSHSRLVSLQPRQTETGASWYLGTADSIAQNIDYLDNIDADYVLILSGDHIYRTTYNEMIDLHISSNADATISVIEVPLKEASRFGIMTTDKNSRVIEFEEKPKKPKSSLASMGVYVFSWKVLKKYLLEDMKDENSEHDFGKNIIPNMLNDKKKLMAYKFVGYWRDVGTLASLHQANLDVVLNEDVLRIYNSDSKKVFTEDLHSRPQYIGKTGKITRSIVNQGATILGDVDSSSISSDVYISEGAKVTKCVLMEGSYIGKGVRIHNAIVAPNVKISDKSKINVGSKEVILVSKDM